MTIRIEHDAVIVMVSLNETIFGKQEDQPFARYPWSEPADIEGLIALLYQSDHPDDAAAIEEELRQRTIDGLVSALGRLAN